MLEDDLNYDFDYVYAEGHAHRLEKAGGRHFKYDAGGNLVREQDRSFAETEGGEITSHAVETVDGENKVYPSDYAWGKIDIAAAENKKSGRTATGGYYYRDYSWNERNLLSNTTDALMTKNIFLGTERIVTKQCSKDTREGFAEAGTQSEADQQYYYHADHLGSVSAITDSDGDVYERLEYTPYGEVWIDLQYGTTAFDFDTPYRFTGKELDEETGLYYYGARYLDPRYSVWKSADPALGEYMSPDKDKKYGIFDTVNLNLYHYGHNNPIQYTDPDGRKNKVAIVGNDNRWGYRKTFYEAALKTGNPIIHSGILIPVKGIGNYGAVKSGREAINLLRNSGSIDNPITDIFFSAHGAPYAIDFYNSGNNLYTSESDMKKKLFQVSKQEKMLLIFLT